MDQPVDRGRRDSLRTSLKCVAKLSLVDFELADVEQVSVK